MGHLQNAENFYNKKINKIKNNKKRVKTNDLINFFTPTLSDVPLLNVGLKFTKLLQDMYAIECIL